MVSSYGTHILKPARILTPEYIAVLYTAFSQIPPFHVYPLPPADEVKFSIIKNPYVHGMFLEVPKMEIEISYNACVHFDVIQSTLLHEMTHMALYIVGDKGFANHGRSFNKIRDAYARMYNLDPRSI